MTMHEAIILMQNHFKHSTIIPAEHLPVNVHSDLRVALQRAFGEPFLDHGIDMHIRADAAWDTIWSWQGEGIRVFANDPEILVYAALAQ